jgi:murein DD-endopeptidase MepM/ murein hydrolase activator NlpD
LVLALLFLFSSAVALATPAEARDWTPQIKATRRAQIYWEDLMRQADKEIQRLKKARKQTFRKVKKTEDILEKRTGKRATAKKRLKLVKADLAEARRQTAAAPLLEVPAIETLRLLLLPLHQAALTLTPPAIADDAATAAVVADTGDQRTLERKVKHAKRSLKVAKRKARRTQRNWNTLKARVRTLKADIRGSQARRETAERNLGSRILAMSRYARIRAIKKSDTRPGVTTRFAWPVTGRISQRYHARHDGIDIVRYKGAPVRAMAFGVVTFVGWNPWDKEGRAFMVVVTHAGGHETLYGHLQPKRVVRVGEEVKKGHVIGYMGNTGKSTGPHLHLEVRRGRTTLDPLAFL